MCLLVFAAWPVVADDFFNPPRLEQELPPWLQNESSTDKAEMSPGSDTKVSDAPSSTSDQASSGPPPGFWGDDDQDTEKGSGFSFGGGSKSSSGGDAPKDSFKIVAPSATDRAKTKQTCLGWGHPFLGVTMYQKSNTCNFVLGQKIEASKQDVRSLEDHTRSEVLRQVIKGNIKREDSKALKLKYDLVLDILLEAEQTGCKCLN